jgi:hypothetical protein
MSEWVNSKRQLRTYLSRWMFILFPEPGAGVEFQTSQEEYLKRVKELIGDDSIPVEILDVSKWFVNEIVASYYSDGNMYVITSINIQANFHRFCLGDAVHRHPPFNGLGSNTCVQDAFNLAWKIAYVLKNKSGPSLLDSFNAERQPVGQGVITRANQGLRDHIPVWEALGMMSRPLEQRKKHFAELSEATQEGVRRRAQLQTAIEGTANEFHGVGVEMNQRYESKAVYLQDESPRPPLPKNPILNHEITTYPGSRLPHAWLNTRMPGKQISTIDLAGHGAFCLITGIGGERWKKAADSVAKAMGININAYSVGWGQDYEDVYFDWARRREVAEDGCVLVRPDRFVAWRAFSIIPGCEEKLLAVMKSILSR